MERIANTTTAITASSMTNVGAFMLSLLSGLQGLRSGLCSFFNANFRVQRLALSVGTKQQIQEACKDCQCYEEPTINGARSDGDHSSDLIDAQSRAVCQQTLVSNGKPEPFLVIHLTFDGTHRCETGGAEQVKYEISICGNRRQACSQVSPDFGAVFSNLGKSVQKAKGCHDVFQPSPRFVQPSGAKIGAITFPMEARIL